DLGEIVGVFLFESLALDLAIARSLQGFVLPYQRVDHVSAGQLGSVDDEPVGMPSERAIHGDEGECLPRRELEADGGEMLARAFLEVLASFEDFARPRREHGFAPPVILNATRAFVPDG